MDSINTILGDKDFKEPDEVSKLKDYIQSKYNSSSQIKVNPKGLIIIVGSSALASALRLSLPEIKKKLDISVPLIIRIR